MKFLFDYSKLQAFEQKGIKPSYKSEWALFMSLRSGLCSPPYDEARVALFYQLATQLNESACTYGAELEIIVNQDNGLAGLTWRGAGFEIFHIEESPTKTALLLALQSANSVHFNVKDGNIQIFTVFNL